MIYRCENCKFLFERVNETLQCPTCGKEAVRTVTAEEKEAYEKLKREFTKT